METFETLGFERRGGVAWIMPDRPTAHNALDLGLARDLFRASLLCNDDPEVRAVLIAPRGGTFCPGGDLKSFAATGDQLPRHVREVTTYLHGAISRLARLDAPVVIAVNGIAAGAGMSLALTGDVVLAARSARFTMAYTGIGLCPDGAATYYLPRLVGLARALDLTLTNRLLDAVEAQQLGLVSRVVPDEELEQEAAALAEQLAAGPTRAYGAAKRLLRGAWNETLETQMELESQALAELAASADAREGIAAFLAKRKPGFRGREGGE
jgi:2-(1,2-epoxy-1,2-dihydrophenyl)acetyl-CoA isomerase